jgi:hypothetical protein
MKLSACIAKVSAALRAVILGRFSIGSVCVSVINQGYLGTFMMPERAPNGDANVKAVNGTTWGIVKQLYRQ